jgi:single-stranded-DNA-specific exonuclease
MDDDTGLRRADVTHPLIRDLMTARGLTGRELADFLDPQYDKLFDPFLLKDMDKAVERILRAVRDREEMAVYGDYDIDGITASALMMEVLEKLGGVVRSYIPDRFEEGYGLNLEALKILRQQGVSLVVTVDCGITSVSEVAWAAAAGLDVVITDHHTVPEKLPLAAAVVNPKQPDDNYPFKELAGVGVAFKLVQALQRHSADSIAQGQEKWLLDLVALGTVCDVVPLVGENRILVSYGLKVLNKTRRPGLVALANVGGVDIRNLNSYHLGFVLGPRLNAAGRIEHASKSLGLMRSANPLEAADDAQVLNELNKKRLKDQAVVMAAAESMAEKYKNDPILVLAHEDWSHGLVGIVASRLVEKWRKPVLVIQIMGDTAKGSARSVAGFDIIQALRSFEQHFERLGGHYFAAGFTFKSKLIVQLRKDLIDYCRKHGLVSTKTDKLKEPEVKIDDLGLLDTKFWEALEQLEPFGHGNPRPIFTTAVSVTAVTSVGKDGSHLKLGVRDQKGNNFKAIAFNAAKEHSSLGVGSSVNINYQLTKNEYLGRSNLELLVTEINYE